MALSYDVCVNILYDHVASSFGDRPEQSLQRPCGDPRYGNRTVVVQSSCNLHHLAQKSHDAPALSLRASTINLKSLHSILGPK